jgi:hypothetical protein
VTEHRCSLQCAGKAFYFVDDVLEGEVIYLCWPHAAMWDTRKRLPFYERHLRAVGRIA